MGDEERFRIIDGGNRPHDGRIEYLVRRLFANLLRVSARTRKPEDIEEQILGLAVLLAEARQSQPTGIPIERLSSWIDADDTEQFRNIGTERDQERWRADGTASQVRTINDMVRGALRLTAARVTGNRTHEALSESLLLDAVRSYEEGRARRRQAVMDERRAARRAISPHGSELSQAMLDALAWMAHHEATGKKAHPLPLPSTLAALHKRKLLANGPKGYVLTRQGSKTAARLPKRWSL